MTQIKKTSTLVFLMEKQTKQNQTNKKTPISSDKESKNECSLQNWRTLCIKKKQMLNLMQKYEKYSWWVERQFALKRSAGDNEQDHETACFRHAECYKNERVLAWAERVQGRKCREEGCQLDQCLVRILKATVHES